MKKYIHYCWFGGNSLSKLAKKCIESWKKYLPDYEIIEWNEKNFDINICPFVKQAYENKKWAFVSDYARLYALYNYGGLYLDTDVEILRDIKFLEENEFFMGREDENYFATAVIGSKNEKSEYVKKILDYYDSLAGFDPNIDIFNYANPRIITRIITEYDKEVLPDGIEIYDKRIKIYPQEYFCPLSYDYSQKRYTENTCMVHYFNATWTPKGEKLAITLYRKFGSKNAKKILNVLYYISGLKNRIIDFIKRKIWALKMKYSIHFHINKRVRNVKKILEESKSNYIAIHHPDWIGVSHSTQDVFKETLPLREQNTLKEAKKIAKTIVESKKKKVIFNAFAFGWDMLCKEIKELDSTINIKVILHGSPALLIEDYDWNVTKTIFELYNQKIIDEICTVKKSLYEFYKTKGYNTKFIMNTVNIEDKEKYRSKNKEKNNYTKIGLYASGDRWVKNIYNQLCAASLVKDVQLDCVPLNPKIVDFCNILKLNCGGTYNNVPREEMFERMASNDINIYVTFTECAPLLPLESLELGVPCITGDNHHYFEGTELEKYLVVAKEDNIMEIYKKIQYALENKEKIIELYDKWKIEYDKEVEKNNQNVLE